MEELPDSTVVIEPPPVRPTDASPADLMRAEQLDAHGLTPEDFPEEEG
jgi:hypothetical protein